MTKEEAIKNIKAHCYFANLIPQAKEALDVAIKALEQEPKTGHWIFCEGIKGKDNVEKCSCCQSHWKEAVIYRKDTQEYLRTRLLYCPACGAKMLQADSESQKSEE